MSRPRFMSLVTIAAVLTGCGTGATPEAPVTVTVTQSAHPEPSAPGPTLQPSAEPTSATPSATDPTFDTYPSGYPLAFVREILQVQGHWAARLDPVTLCTADSKDAACAEVVKHLETEYEIRNVSTRQYTVALTPTAAVRRLASGEPGDYVEEPPTAATFPVSAVVSFLAEVHLDAQGRLTDVTEWWHP
jgi:hypothetical protein